MAEAILKRCTQCQEVKPTSLFSPRKTSKDGLYSWCKACSSARMRGWSAKNKERISERNKAKYWADPEAARAKRTAHYRGKTGGGPKKPAQAPIADDGGTLTLRCTKCDQRKPLAAFYLRNGRPRTDCKDCCTERSAAYIAAHKEQVIAYKKLWTKENAGRVRKIRSARYAESETLRADSLAKAKEWRLKNPEKRAVIAQNYKHRRRAQEDGGISSAELLAWRKAQRKACHWCGVKCAKDFHIDHIQPLARGGQHVASNLCIACPSCNLRKNAKDPIDFAQSLGLLL